MTLGAQNFAVLREQPTASHTTFEFAEIYELYFDEVARWARAMGAGSADLEDICQDAFVIVRRRLKSFDGENIKGWLYRITQRTVRSHQRSAWVKRALFIADEHWMKFPSQDRDPERQFDRRDRREMIERALRRLSLRKRTALILHFVEGKSGDEIAELEGVPVGTIYTRIYHAKKDLAANLRREELR